MQSKLYLFSRTHLARQILLLAATIISVVPCGAAAENAQPTPKPMMWLRAPEKGKVYNFWDLVHESEVAGKVVQLEVLPKIGNKSVFGGGSSGYGIMLYDTHRVAGFVYCTKEGQQILGDGTATKNRLIYVFVSKYKRSPGVYYFALGSRFDVERDGNTIYFW